MIQILMIEDDAADAMLVQEYLSESTLNYEIETVDTLTKALTLLQQETCFDLVMLDLTLPDATFLEGLKQVLETSDRIPIIILTGLNDKQIARKALHHGAQDYLIKGRINTELLERACTYAIERQNQQNHIQQLNEILYTIRRINEIITTEKSKLKLIESACKLFSRTNDHYYSSIILKDGNETSSHSECTKFDQQEDRITKHHLDNIEELFIATDKQYIYLPYQEKTQTCLIKNEQCDASTMIIKLSRSSHIFGYLILCLKKRIFSNDELNLLLEAASDISFALYALEEEKKHKIVKKELSKSEARFQSIFETAGNVILTTDANGMINECNPKIYALLGYQEEEIRNTNLLDYVSADFKIQLRSMLRTVLSKNYILEKEIEMVDKKDRIIDVNMNISVLSQNANSEQQTICIIDDISEKKKAERELEFLYKNAIRLSEYSTSDKIYEVIAEELSKIVPNAIIAVNSIDMKKGLMQNQVILGLQPYEQQIKELLGADLYGFVFPFEKDQLDLSQRLISYEGGLHYVTFGQIPKDIALQLEKILGIGNMYGIGFSTENVFIGNVAILMQGEFDIPNPALVETFVYQASIALKRYQTYQELEKSLADKDVLLMEIHHRVKNNMQIIISLLKIQMRKLKKPELKNLIRDSYQRIRTMALIHDKFYHTMDITYINMKEYIDAMVSQLRMFYVKKVSVDWEIAEMKIDMNTAIPVGLLINEILTNSMQHGFTESSKNNHIQIIIRKHDSYDFYLSISDNGIGLPDDKTIHDFESVGFELIRILTLQLHGKMDVNSENGLHFEFWLNALV